MTEHDRVSQVRRGEDLPAGSPGSGIRRPTSVLIAAGLLAAALSAVAVDGPLSQWLLAGHCPKPLITLFHVAEPFGHGMGVVLILLAIHQLAPGYRWALPFVVAGSLGAGLAANIVKMSITRIRPHHFDFATGIWHSFGRWFPLTSAGSNGQSFPSAHMATAVGLATVLTWLAPRGRFVFFLLAALVACHRVASGAHFLSDVLAGAAVGFMMSQLAIACARRAENRRANRRPRPLATPAPRTGWHGRRHTDPRARRPAAAATPASLLVPPER